MFCVQTSFSRSLKPAFTRGQKTEQTDGKNVPPSGHDKCWCWLFLSLCASVRGWFEFSHPCPLPPPLPSPPLRLRNMCPFQPRRRPPFLGGWAASGVISVCGAHPANLIKQSILRFGRWSPSNVTQAARVLRRLFLGLSCLL